MGAEGSIHTPSVRLRTTHRTLYYSYSAFALVSLFLGLNFLFLHPTFNPLNIPKGFMGIVFLALGITKLVLLNVYRNMRLLRATQAAGVTVMLFYSGALTVAYFQLHQTSLQLPLTYLGLSILGLPLITEPYINPATAAINGNNGKNRKNGAAK